MHNRPLFTSIVLALAVQLPGNLVARADDDKSPRINLSPVPADPSASPMRGVIERYSDDLTTLERYYSMPLSPRRPARLTQFYQDQLRNLELLNFDNLDQAGRVDYILFRRKLLAELRDLDREQKRLAESTPYVAFSPLIVKLEETRQRVDDPDFEHSTKTLGDLSQQVAEARKLAGKQLKTGTNASPAERVLANRTAALVGGLRQTLRRWHDFYAGYDPDFAWWAEQPYQTADKELGDYVVALRGRAGGSEESDPPPAGFGGGGGGRRGGRRGGGGDGESGPSFGGGRIGAGGFDSQDDSIVGDPIGRQALLDALDDEMIPYTPEELIDLANQEFAWCEKEQRRAARDLGFGDDWHKALDYVSGLHVKPGEQPRLIRKLMEEAIKFVEDRDLVTVPELCKETWRMDMMTPERQRVNPFFTGGEVISVSYPTATMSYEDKLMSIRGNNIHFSRATVFHEMVPGHQLQGFMSARYEPHRRLFRTPFLIEGWALYWEMLLWDLDFPKSPEDRVGMLFWRSHRCARIIFSLNFHLGKWSPQQCIDFLVDRVGHERRNATAEVRRSFGTDYGPLYQAAYMLGGLEIRGLHKELVDSGKMTNRQFHDAILQENAIPIAMIRASLTKEALTRDYTPNWHFYQLEASQSAKPPAEK